METLVLELLYVDNLRGPISYHYITITIIWCVLLTSAWFVKLYRSSHCPGLSFMYGHWPPFCSEAGLNFIKTKYSIFGFVYMNKLVGMHPEFYAGIAFHPMHIRDKYLTIECSCVSK